MKRGILVGIDKTVKIKVVDGYISSSIQKFLAVNRNDIVILFRDYNSVSSRAVSCAIYKLLDKDYSIIKTNIGDVHEQPFPVIYDKTSSNRTSPYSAIYFLKDKSDNKMIVRLKLSTDPYEHSFIEIYLPSGKLDLGRKFFNYLEKSLLSFTDLRLKGNGEFLESFQKLTDNDIILPEEIKRAVTANVTGFVERYKAYSESKKTSGFSLLRRGVILFGAPGTGKSLTVRWLMSTLNCNFIIVTGEQLRRSTDASNVFTLARMIKPVVVVLEDMDLYGLSRESVSFSSTILNELLNQLDGQADMSGIVTIATANKTEVLDKALAKRPGRFDVIINYKNPSLNERINLLKLNLSKTEMDKPINISYIADITDGFSPAQIVEVIKRSYIIAGEREGNTIRQDDLVSSVAQLKEQPKVLGFKKIDGQTE